MRWDVVVRRGDDPRVTVLASTRRLPGAYHVRDGYVDSYRGVMRKHDGGRVVSGPDGSDHGVTVVSLDDRGDVIRSITVDVVPR